MLLSIFLFFFFFSIFFFFINLPNSTYVVDMCSFYTKYKTCIALCTWRCGRITSEYYRKTYKIKYHQINQHVPYLHLYLHILYLQTNRHTHTHAFHPVSFHQPPSSAHSGYNISQHTHTSTSNGTI